MHMWNDGWYFGMHLLWWIFWVVLLVALLGVFTPVPRTRVRETPLQILQRRYAQGEIGSEEYEERKAKLERDAGKA
jgi:putative membrane protein